MQIKEGAKATPTAKKTDNGVVKGNPSSGIWSNLKENYITKTNGLAKALDLYLIYCILTGILQVVYYFIEGSFQYNAFLGGFISSVGSFVLAGKSDAKVFCR